MNAGVERLCEIKQLYISRTKLLGKKGLKRVKRARKYFEGQKKIKWKN